MTGRALIALVLFASFTSGCAGNAPASTVPATAVAPTNVIVPPASNAPTARRTLVPTVQPVATHPTGENAAWTIQSRGGKPLIQVIDAAGSSLFAPAAALAGAYQNNPDWSPDGEWLTFTNAEGEHDDLYVVKVDGSELRKVYDCESPCLFVDDPAWSPDGESIAVCKAQDDANPSALIAVDVATGAESVLFQPRNDEFCAGPRWSSDGARIVLEIGTFTGPITDAEVTGVSLAVLDLSEEPASLRELTEPELFAATADWSFETDRIVYSALVRPDQDATDLFVVSPDDGDSTRLTFIADNGGSAIQPSWDTDATGVVFVDDSGALMRVDVASGEVESAFVSAVFANHPRVRPEP